MASNFFKDIGDELADFVDWVKEQLEDEAIRKSIADDLGLSGGQTIQKPPDQTLSSVDSYRSNANPDREAFVALLNDVRAAYQNVRTAISGFGSSDITRLNAIVYLIFDQLALNYVRLYFPRGYFLIQALSAIVEDTSALDDNPYAIERFFGAIARAIEFTLNPIGYTFQSLKDGVADEARARKVSDRIFPQLAAFFTVGAKLSGHTAFAGTREVIYGWDSLEVPKKGSCLDFTSGSGTRVADTIAERMLTVAYPLSQDATPTAQLTESVGMTLAIVPKSDGAKPGLLIGVGGDGAVEFPVTDRWKFLIQASARPAFSLLLSAEDWNLDLAGHTPTNVPLNVALVSTPDASDVTYALPHADETRLEIGQLVFSFGFDGTSGGIRAQALRCAVVIATKDQDGFLGKILPKDGLRVPFSVGAGFSTEKRFYKEGRIDWPTGHSSIPSLRTSRSARALTSRAEADAPPASTAPGDDGIPSLSGGTKPELGLHTTIAIGKSLAGVRLDSLRLGVGPSNDASSATTTAEASVSLTARIGPVTATVERIGLEMGLGFPESGGNAGFADFSIGFKPPNGAGLVVDSPFVSGGGFLSFDSDRGQYAGLVQLTIQKKLTVTAIGIISTRLPSGEKGFSFVVLITAQGFKPIPLGLGFTLTAIGGLLAINRTCNEEFLREGIKSRALDDLLFPRDVAANAVRIFGTLNNAFPPSPGSYLFGPVLRICWGSPPVITMDLAAILELGNRSRLVILGRVSAIMPSEKHDLVRLQMNAFGVIDFDQGSVSLDAILFDSRLAGKFPITGSMALRLNWGSAPQFALSIGGFHPAFKPPANFPALERLAITFSNTDNYKLRAECYIAVTANTVQFGARMDVAVRVLGFTVLGAVGLDVLIQFSPFGFIAAFLVAFQIKRGSHNLFKVKVHGTLTGPKPLFLRGKATFEIFWCDFSLPLDYTFVEGDRPPAAVPVAVTSQLLAALDGPSNWTGQLADNDRRTVALREVTGAGVIPLHPLARLSVKQTIVPLDVDIDRFANAPPADGRRFGISNVRVSGKSVGADRIRDFFAPAQFLDLSDDEKLAAPSFELMAAGVSIATASFVFTGDDADILEDEELAFETLILDSEAPAPVKAAPTVVDGVNLSRQVRLGAAGRTGLRRSETDRYATAGARNTVTARAWAVASADDGSPQAAPGIEAGTSQSYSESFQAVAKLRARRPAAAAALMLVRTGR